MRIRNSYGTCKSVHAMKNKISNVYFLIANFFF